MVVLDNKFEKNLNKELETDRIQQSSIKDKFDTQQAEAGKSL